MESELATTGGKVQPTTLQYALWHDEYLRSWIERSVWSRREEPEEHLRNLTRLATNYFMTQRFADAKRESKRMVGDKTPLQRADIVREISEVYPEAKVIHIVRDGRDRAISRMHHIWRSAVDRGGVHRLEPESLAKRDRYQSAREEFGASGESIFTENQLRKAAIDWRERVGKTVEDGPALLGESYVDVCYEDLLERPEREGAGLLHFLGVSTDSEVVERCVEATSFKKLSGRERGEEQKSLDFKKRRKGVAGDWKNVFTERDKEIFKKEAGDLLIELGYESHHDW